MLMIDLDSDHFPIEANELVKSTCPKCNKAILRYRGEIRYLSFLSLPVFPFAKHQQKYCPRCHKSIERQDLSHKVVPIHRLFTKFVGSVLIIAILAYWYLHNAENKKLELAYLTQPAVNDVWILNTTKMLKQTSQNDIYQVAQVITTSDQDIKLKLSLMDFLSVSRAVKSIRLDYLMLNGYFDNEPLLLAKKDLLQLKQIGVIESAHRPKNLTLFGGLVMQPNLLRMPVIKYRPNPLNQEAIWLFQTGNYKEAALLFEEAAKQGNAWAQFNLAGMYFEGQGVDENHDLARLYLEQAAAQGHSNAEKALVEK